VEWAVATRFQADRDLVLIPESQGSKLDPSTRNGVGAKMGLDATKPLSADEMRFKRIRVPGEERVDLDRVVVANAGADWRKAVRDGKPACADRPVSRSRPLSLTRQ
jgi:2,5-furandicarboxylate decarboxylase 1